jgi:hypothetical protein
MKLPELQGTLLITERRINDLNTIKSKIQSRLNSMKARTYVTNGVIHFVTISTMSLTGYMETNHLLFRIYKEGSIAVDKDVNELKITWFVRLDTLLILAFCSSSMLGVFLYFPMILGFVGSILSSFGFFLLFVFLGTQFIKYKITELIESCVYRATY